MTDLGPGPRHLRSPLRPNKLDIITGACEKPRDKWHELLMSFSLLSNTRTISLIVKMVLVLLSVISHCAPEVGSTLRWCVGWSVYVCSFLWNCSWSFILKCNFSVSVCRFKCCNKSKRLNVLYYFSWLTVFQLWAYLTFIFDEFFARWYVNDIKVKTCKFFVGM